jgi:hypothetical protein
MFIFNVTAVNIQAENIMDWMASVLLTGEYRSQLQQVVTVRGKYLYTVRHVQYMESIHRLSPSNY